MSMSALYIFGYRVDYYEYRMRHHLRTRTYGKQVGDKIAGSEQPGGNGIFDTCPHSELYLYTKNDPSALDSLFPSPTGKNPSLTQNRRSFLHPPTICATERVAPGGPHFTFLLVAGGDGSIDGTTYEQAQ